MNSKFDAIRSYRDPEVRPVLSDLTRDPEFRYVLQKIYTDEEIEKLFVRIRKINTIFDFQSQCITQYVNRLIDQTITDFQVKGIENLEKDKAYLFISNHRDIILDSALLNEVLFRNNLQTSEIGIGNNLLIYRWIERIVRLNKTFVIKRDVEGRELWNSLSVVSAYIRHTIAERKTSVWIAQRQGRTKDGNDLTDPALLKMLNMSGTPDHIQNFEKLHILPVSVSYEYEPAIESKLAATYAKLSGRPYQKTPKDDLNDMGKGLYSFKGRVCLTFGQTIDYQKFKECKNKVEFINSLAKEIDRRIHGNYELSKNNYMAFDQITRTAKWLQAGKYTKQEEEKFQNQSRQFADLFPQESPRFLQNIFYEIYSKPLINKMQIRKNP